MKKFNIIEGKMCLFLVTAIIILCAGFFIIGCGVGPATKAANTNAGQFAVDFNAAAGASIVALNVSHASFPSLLGTNAGKTLTIEAWVQPKASSTTPGGIFGRYDARGSMMWVTSAVPKFAIRVFTAPAASSTDYSVSGTTTLINDTWYHLAGVLVNQDHSATHAAIDCEDGGAVGSDDAGGNAENPHLDIYVDGVLEACATTFDSTDLVTDPAAAPQGILDPNKYLLADATVNSAEIGWLSNALTPLVDSVAGGNFEGIIEEVRVWTSARTASQIADCKDAELSIASGNCNINDSSLLGYWRFNTGSGSDIHDSSGNGLNGAMEVGVTHWSDGWVAGKF